MFKINSKYIFLAAVFFIVSAAGRVNANGPGTSAVLTLLEPLSAAAAGTNNASIASSGSGYLNSNPASIARASSPQASLFYRQGIMEDNYASAIAIFPLPWITLGAGAQYYTTGKFSVYNLAGDKVNEVGQEDMIIHIAAAGSFSKLSAGLNIKFIDSKIFGERATGSAADAGLQVKDIINNLTVGAAVRNFGPNIIYINDSEPLPLNVAGGVSYNAGLGSSDLILSAEFPYYVNEEEMFALAGAEYIYASRIAVRGGYRLNLTDTDAQDISLTLGMGITIGNYSIDYATGFADDINSPHSISLNINF